MGTGQKPPMSTVKHKAANHGEILTAISDGIVALLKGVLRSRTHAREILLRG